MLLNCEKDLDNADEIDLDNVVEKWAKQVVIIYVDIHV
jgi:exosome complex RNA-binding protein Rrp42 (RNase PH superfamily)